MNIDLNLELSDSQAVTATAISTNVYDTGANPTLKDLGTGYVDVELVIYCTVAAVSAGATTVTFSLESDSTADLATSATVHWTSIAVPKASLIVGYEVARVKLPAGNYERYLGVRYTVAVANLTAGSFNAFLCETPQANRSYPSGFSFA